MNIYIFVCIKDAHFSLMILFRQISPFHAKLPPLHLQGYKQWWEFSDLITRFDCFLSSLNDHFLPKGRTNILGGPSGPPKNLPLPFYKNIWFLRGISLLDTNTWVEIYNCLLRFTISQQILKPNINLQTIHVYLVLKYICH